MAPYDRGTTTTVPPAMVKFKAAGLSDTRRSATKNSLEYSVDSDSDSDSDTGGSRRTNLEEEEDDILSQTSNETISSQPESENETTTTPKRLEKSKDSKKEGFNNNNQNHVSKKNHPETSIARKNTDLPKRLAIPSVLFDIPFSESSKVLRPIAVPARLQQQKTTIANDDNTPPKQRFVLPTVFTAVSGTGNITMDREATRQLIESTLTSTQQDISMGALTIRKNVLTREEADAWRKFAAKKSTTPGGGGDKPFAASKQQQRHCPPPKNPLRHSSSCPNDITTNHQCHEKNPLQRKTGPAADDSYSSNQQWLAHQKNPLLRKTYSPNKIMSPKQVVSISGQRIVKSHNSPTTNDEALEYVRRWCSSKRAAAHEKITISLSDEKQDQKNKFESIAAEKRSRALRKEARQRIEKSVISEEKQRMWALRKKEQQARQKVILPPTDPWRSATKAQKKKKAENDMSRYVSDTLHQTRRRGNSEFEIDGKSWYHPSSSISPRSSTATGRTKKNTGRSKNSSSTLTRPSSFSSRSTKNVGSNGPHALTRRSSSTSKLQVNR